ncbi:MAG: periplasmic heavy metal sensor [Candidatus Aminicenantes bacterium]|nr:periplasmic heavy metal sensor [Candidatus Aminicenantes bacterium]NIM84597.1 periplasmic heavy metal sensor [Candidatus Aminicenantes bacterium]NIN24119.1 periplasmic heavy metal sensor [Candidatus Aminicenantes bacterium]NIN47825.1 periplasmic heavy metal sensor [Candidatus Aminicenantes bacterium]NIN90763.1 periplasmic heavy metal sensor [Candidatus Aminicenantes bacterium]
MKNKWLKIILAASLALNLAFVSSTIYRKVTDRQKAGKTGNEHKQETPFKSEFNLKEDQKTGIKKIIREFKMNLLKYKQDILDKRIDIIEAMSETEFNPDDIDTKTKELNRLENELNVLFVEALIQINALLEPEQRLKFLYRLSRNWFFIEKKYKTRPGRRAFQQGGTHD